MMMNRSLLPALLKTLTMTTTTNRCTTKKWTAQVRATGRFSSCSAATARHTPMKKTVVGLGAGPVLVGDAHHLVAPRPRP